MVHKKTNTLYCLFFDRKTGISSSVVRGVRAYLINSKIKKLRYVYTCITLSVIHVYKHIDLDLKLGHSEFVGKKDRGLLCGRNRKLAEFTTYLSFNIKRTLTLTTYPHYYTPIMNKIERKGGWVLEGIWKVVRTSGKILATFLVVRATTRHCDKCDRETDVDSMIKQCAERMAL